MGSCADWAGGLRCPREPSVAPRTAVERAGPEVGQQPEQEVSRKASAEGRTTMPRVVVDAFLLVPPNGARRLGLAAESPERQNGGTDNSDSVR